MHSYINSINFKIYKEFISKKKKSKSLIIFRSFLREQYTGLSNKTVVQTRRLTQVRIINFFREGTSTRN